MAPHSRRITTHRWTIAIRPSASEKLRKITTIESLGGDGFSATLPLHKTSAGYLFKQPVAPGMNVPRSVHWAGATQFGPNDKVRLKYHLDGFAEFSEEKSDDPMAKLDLISGEVKGLGLFSAPVARPSIGGPAVSIFVYGIDQFLTPTRSENTQLVVVEPDNFYYRNCSPDSANTWLLAVYPFPRNVYPPIRMRGNQPTVTLALEALNPPIASILELAVLFLPQEKMYLGLCVYRLREQLQSKSGWLMSGPSNLTASGRGHALMGIYPETEILFARPQTP